MENNRKNSLAFLTIFIFAISIITAIGLNGPSPVLTFIMDDLNINMAQGGFLFSVIFASVIVFNLAGPYIQDRIGLKQMFNLTMLFTIVGLLLNLVTTSYALLIIGRIVLGVGFGLAIPFTGAAIMHWYNPAQQVKMNTAYALVPYIASLFVYGLTIPMFRMLGESWRMTLSVWGFVGIGIMVIWMISMKSKGPGNGDNTAENEEVKSGENVYIAVLKRKEVVLLIITFVCDFISFSIASGLLPTFYITEHGMSEDMANNITLIFPIGAIIAALVAGVIMTKTGRNKPLLWFGQLARMVGSFLVFLGGASALGLFGVVLLGVGNAVWIPAMYQVPMELENMTPNRVAAAFAIITSCGFVGGIVGPPLAGWIGEAYSLGLAIGLSGIPCAIGLVACLMIRETGPGAKNKKTS